jgi:ribonuclease HII
VYQYIQQRALAYSIGMVSHTQIDRYNILWATLEAMLRALRRLPTEPDLLLIDGNTGLATPISQRLIVRGDACCTSIAAASVVAKVTRDRLMTMYSKRYPAYGFEKHKGYPTREHYACLQTYGPCPIHRRSFRGVVTVS